MASNDTVSQSKIFLYELNNTRYEYGFAASEEWTLDLVPAAKLKALEEKFYPLLSTKIAPENILEMLDLLSVKLSNAVAAVKNNVMLKRIAKENVFLLAYCATRLKS